MEQAIRQALYALNPAGSGSYTSWNAEQRVEATFRSTEVSLDPAGSAGTNTVKFRLAGYGYGKQLRAPQPAWLAVSGNRIEYRRGPLVEWYVNEARGLEQGFTLAARSDDSEGPLVIALEVNGELRPKLGASGEVELLDRAGHVHLRYADLKAWDAHSRPLESRLEVSGRQVRLIVQDGKAVYPVTIDPMLQLLASDGWS